MRLQFTWTPSDSECVIHTKYNVLLQNVRHTIVDVQETKKATSVALPSMRKISQ